VNVLETKRQHHVTMTPGKTIKRYQDGRDEMNLADFPISALQRQQPSDAEGRKLDRMVFEASRYDASLRRRVTQRVTLTSSGREGLPTPADEHVVLALLFVAKHSNNFTDATVHFAPGQLFDIMGWAPNGRSYERLRGVLRRLKSLNLRYENAWWDAAGRAYEEEVATGIISGYRIARQVSGPRKPGSVPQSWVTWTQQFHESLQTGNIKRLDLEVFFRLRSPTAQRMYRFLDKRFYNAPAVAMDLVEFACGHIGLTETGNVAVLKRRLAAAIQELEDIEFIARAAEEQRYQKVRPGVWRVHFHAGPLARSPAARQSAEEPLPLPPPPAAEVQAPAAPGDAANLAAEFYRCWGPGLNVPPGPRDLEQAQGLIRAHGAEQARELILCLAQVVKKKWPDCRSLSGAAQKYLPDAVRLHKREQRRAAQKLEALAVRRQSQESLRRQQDEERQLHESWDALPPSEQEDIRRNVLARLAGATAPEAFLRRLCLEEMVRRRGQGHLPPASREASAPGSGDPVPGQTAQQVQGVPVTDLFRDVNGP
jgi:hypothetical protein